MVQNLLVNLRNFLVTNNIDYLLINTADEFLLEYNQKELSARYWVTKFTGSTGEVLLTKDKLYLFVDGRYHIQADNEVDKTIVEVVKLGLNETLIGTLKEIVVENSVFAVVSKKVSLRFYNTLCEKFKELNIKIKQLDFDPVFRFIHTSNSKNKEVLNKVPLEIAGVSVAEKLAFVQEKLAENEYYLVTNLEDIAYLTNLRSYKIPFSSFFKAKMLISKDNSLLFTDETIDEIENCEILPLDAFKTILKSVAIENEIIFEPSAINLADYKIICNNSHGLSVNDGAHVFNLKSVKNESELKHYKEIYKKTDEVVEYISELVNSNENFSESELASITEEQFKKRGAKSLSFKTILAIGDNSAIIHYSNHSKDKFLKNGDLVLLDCGAYFEGGYATDITRTFVRAEANNEQKYVYTTVLKGFINGFQLKSNDKMCGCDIDKVVRETLGCCKLNGFAFSHGTGHGVGISVHENPPIISQSILGTLELKPNMVFSIEPGLYKKNCGGVRLENVVYLKQENGVFFLKALSKAKFEEKLIDYNLLTGNEINFLTQWQEKKI